MISEASPKARFWPRALKIILVGLGLAMVGMAPQAWAQAQVVALASGEYRLASDSPFATSFEVIDSGVPGPTVLVTGGLHGNEPAGARAARQIAGWKIASGRLIVIARTNELALLANERRTPGVERAEGDLNRQFPRAEGGHANGLLAQAVWDLLREQRPDYLIDLHEGFDFTRRNPKSVGNSVIATAPLQDLGRGMIAAVNATIEEPEKHFSLKRQPVLGSLARSAFDVLGIPSMIVETTTKGQAVAFRVRQQRVLIHSLLVQLLGVEHGPQVLVGTRADGAGINVALYASAGVSGQGPKRLELLLTTETGFHLRQVCASDIRDGSLAQFDTVIFPGGSGSGQARALGPTGRSSVTDFVEGGGGYLGICAGAYLAANNYEWSLGILDANVIDRAHWKRGTGDVALEWTSGQQPGPIKYANGPLYARGDDPLLPDFEILATYRGEINKNDAPVGVMMDSPAIVVGTFGGGTVVCSSPHPEQTQGLEPVLRDLVRRSVARIR